MKRSIVIAAGALALIACENKNDTPSNPHENATAAVTLPTVSATATAALATSASATASASPSASASASAEESIPAPPDVATPPKDAQKTASGLVTKVIQKGTGKDHPKATEKVKVNYTGWTKEGKMFDSSVGRGGKPITFKLNEVIKGWTEGVQLMVTGEKRRLWIPAAMAYGDHPQMGAPAGDLTFDVELLDIIKPKDPPPTPPDVKAPPKDAQKTASGLAYKVIKKGDGKDTPTARSTVTVNYTGWTTDGKMFDSSLKDGEPISFALNRVIKGWTEGVQLMHVGDTVRFWIPAELAYGEHPGGGRPAGMLVFDIELLKID